MAVTSLGFNIFSTYDGSGLNRAQRAMRGMDSTVRRSTAGLGANTKASRIASVAHNALGRAARRSAASIGQHSRMSRLATTATRGFHRATSAASRALGIHTARVRGSSAVHNLFRRSVDRTRMAVDRHSGALRRSALALARHDGSSRRAGFGLRTVFYAAALAAPALLTLGKGAMFATGAFIAMTIGAGTAAGVFGAVMIAAARRALNLEAAGKRLNASQKAFTSSTHALTAAWNRFLDRTSAKTLAPATIVINSLRRGISRLVPLINAVHPVAMKVARAFARWTVANNGLRRFINTIVRYGVPALNHLQMAARHMFAVLGFGFRAFAPQGLKMAAALERGARALRSWAAQGGFQRFIATARLNLPIIRAALRNIWFAFMNVTRALAPLGPAILRVASAFAQIIAAIPPSVLRNMFLLWMLMRRPLFAIMIILAPIAGLFARIVKAIPPWLLNAIVVGMIAIKFALIGWKIAQWALNIALFASPITWLILGIMLLIAAIVFIALKTRWFQTAWRFLWNGIKMVAATIWRWLRTAWRYTVNFFLFIFRAIGTGLRVAWNAVWGAIRFVALSIWNGLRAAWRAVCFAFAVIWRAVSGALRVAWRAVWGALRFVAFAIWRGLRAGWNALKNFFIAVVRALSTGIRAAWRFCWMVVRTVGLAVWRGIRAAWNAVKNFFIRVARILSAGVRAAWRFLWNVIRFVGLSIWRGLRAAWNAFKNFFIRVGRVLSGALRAAWRFMWNAIKGIAGRVWFWLRLGWFRICNFFQSTARKLWAGLKGIFNAGSRWLRTTFWNPVKNFFTKTIPAGWRHAVNTIKKIWNTLKKIISAPVKAIVDVVWNNGARKLWNAVAGLFGGKTIKPFKFKGFKDGGFTGNGGKNDVAGVVHGQEYVLSAKQLKDLGGPKAIGKLGPQALFALKNGEFDNSMRGMSSKNPGRNWTLDTMYKNKMGSVGGLPVGGDGFDPGGFFGGIGDFFKGLGIKISGAFSAVTGFSSKVLSAIGGLDMCTIAPIFNGLIQQVANKGKSLVRGVIPGAPWFQDIIAGGKRQKKGTEGGLGGAGIIQTMADMACDWILAHALCSGCGFTEFRKWKAGDGARAGPSDRRTMAMFACAKKAGYRGSITQGSWSHAGASAGTHAGGGALDLTNPSDKNVGALRSCGFAAWNRGAKWGSPSFSPHIHAIAVGNKNLSGAAAAQVRSFKAGGNGLAGGGKDNFKDSSCQGKSGNCNSFKPLVARAMQANGINQNQMGRFMSLMKKESGCRTGAKNNWDSNARAGNASVGLMQVIPTTFRANHCPGTSRNIMDPYANICAAARYIKRRYGGRVPGSPYASGTRSATPGWHKVGERGPEMVRFAGGETVRTASQTRRASGEGVTAVLDRSKNSGGDMHVHIHGNVYAKSELEFEKMLTGAMQNLKRKGRLPK